MYLDEFVLKANASLFSYEEPLLYLRNRGMTEDDIRRFQLGYVRVARLPKNESADYKQLFERTYKFRSLEKKLIFPLKNVLGHVNGMTVRSISEKSYIQYFLTEAKETGGFFGLYEALPRMMETRKVFVHEGAFNAISFSKIFTNTIASLTSFLNEQQYELLRFFVDKIILIYDKDKAGLWGLEKVINYYGEKNFDTIFMGDSDANA